MHAAVRLPFVSLSLRLVVRFDAFNETHTETTKHAFVTRCTRVVVGVGVFSFIKNTYTYPARARGNECVT